MLVFVLACVLTTSSAQTRNVQRDCDVGALNRRAVRLDPVPYPTVARQRKVYGEVKVRVRINSKGRVVKTTVISGPRLLRGVVVQSASRSTFDPSIAVCESSKFVTGTLRYKFVPPETPSP